MFVIESKIQIQEIESPSMWLDDYVYFIEHVLMVCVDCEPVWIHTHTHTHTHTYSGTSLLRPSKLRTPPTCWQGSDPEVNITGNFQCYVYNVLH